MFKERTLAHTIEEISASFPVVMLTGPRQVGKTTLFETYKGKGRGYVTLDDLDQRQIAQNDPALFLQMHSPPVIIDEVQYAPQLFSAIKIAVDKAKQPGMFWLTGSQKFHLMKGITETLAGRIAIIDMLGLSQAEILGDAEQSVPFIPTKEWLGHSKGLKRKKRDLKSIYHAIWQGSYPKLIADPKASRDVFYRSYIQTYISRDVQEYTKVGDLTAYHRFLRAAAARTGQLINFHNMAMDVDIDPKTAKAWLSILEASGIIYLLQPYHTNVTKRLVKTPKLYFLDTGLCSYLTQWSTPEALEAGAMSGAILETYVFSEILKSYWHNGQSPYLYFYRDRDGREVDLLIEKDQTLYPVEIKKTATPSNTASKHFSVLENIDKKRGHGAVICFVPEIVPLSREVDAIPVGCL